MSNAPSGESRRDLLKKLAVGAAVATAGPASAGVLPIPDAASAGGPWWLLAPLGPGDPLSLGWRAADLRFTQGAALLTLSHPDLGIARVAMSYHQGSPKGLAHTELLDLILMDGGRGDKPTEETVGRVLIGLADVIAKNEERLLEEPQLLARLMTHAERVQRFGPEAL